MHEQFDLIRYGGGRK